MSLCYFESIGFYSAHSLPSASGENKEKRWSKKKKTCLGMNLSVIIQIKKTELSVQHVNPAYSPRCVKHELILYGSDRRARSLGRKRSNKRFLAFLSFIDWSRSARSEHFIHTETNAEIQHDRMPRSCCLFRKTRC